MPDFESIRPYRDEEVPSVVRRLTANPELRDGIASFLFPRLYNFSAVATRTLTRLLIAYHARSLTRVHDVQMMVGRFIDHMVEASVDSLSFSGLEHLDPAKPYLFVSNHRDITLDSAFLSRVLHGEGFPTCRIAVGDNLFGTPHADDLMRLNRGFLVERSVVGAKASYAAMLRTSRYVRHSIEEGASVWIAQRAGRAKDGFDRTEPALLKMLALAWRKQFSRLDELLDAVQIVPVAISYEIDPCDLFKAEELQQRSVTGEFNKAENADRLSMVAGMRGYKGRVHLNFAPPLSGTFEQAEDIARAMDKAIVGGLKVYPANVLARDLLLEEQAGLAADAADCWQPTVWPTRSVVAEPESERARVYFRRRIESVSASLRPFLLLQYANVLRNQTELNAVPSADQASNSASEAG